MSIEQVGEINRACELLLGFAVVLSCPGVRVTLEFDEDELGVEVAAELVEQFPQALKKCLRDSHDFVKDNRPDLIDGPAD